MCYYVPGERTDTWCYCWYCDWYNADCFGGSGCWLLVQMETKFIILIQNVMSITLMHILDLKLHIVHLTLIYIAVGLYDTHSLEYHFSLAGKIGCLL